MTAKELAAIEARYRRAFRRYELALAARNDAICRGVAEGMRHVDIATATGLTRARIAQIVGRGQ